MKYVEMLLRRVHHEYRAYRKGLKALGAFSKLSSSQGSVDKTKKTIYFNLSGSVYSRYLYTLIKFFLMEGYEVYLPKRFRLFAHLHLDPYAKLLLEEKSVHFGSPELASKINFTINQRDLSPDYFLRILKRDSDRNTFHIPISQHPLMYYNGLWNLEISDKEERKKSIFMVGNFKESRYNRISKDKLFDVSSRVDIFSFIKRQRYFLPVDKQHKLQDFVKSPLDNKVILIRSSDFKVPMERFRNIIHDFNFFFALPGFAIPFSHNVVEAMSVGTIPFIQESYANMFTPALKHGFDAYTFKDLNDLDEKINEVFNLTEEELSEIRKNVYEYYNQNLTPAAVVNSIIRSGFEKIYLQAEQYSVNLMLLNPQKYKA